MVTIKKTTAVFVAVIMMLPLIATTSAALSSTLGSQDVGSIVSFEVDGVLTEWLVVQQGSPSDLYYSFEGGTVLLSRRLFPRLSWHSEQVNDYANSNIHAWLNGAFYETLEPNVRSQLMDVRIPYRHGASGGTATTGQDGLECKIFLPSALEVGAGNGDPARRVLNEGVAFAYFTSINTTNPSVPRRIHLISGGGNISWWTRTPNPGLATRAMIVSDLGAIESLAPTSTLGVRPAMVLPNTIEVDTNGRLLVNTLPITEPTTSPPTEPSTSPPTEPTLTEPTDNTPCAEQLSEGVFTPELAAKLERHFEIHEFALRVGLLLLTGIGLYKLIRLVV